MKSRLFGMLIASVGALTLSLAANEASAGTRTASHAGFVPAHRFHHRHHVRPDTAVVAWPGDGSFADLPFPDTVMEGMPPTVGTTGGVHYTHRDEIPWDWVHRYPNTLAQFDKPHAPGCVTETVMVPDGRGGKGEVNVIRCY